MFRRSTVFVIGAGASREVDFPVGTELARAISSMLVRRVDSERRVRYGDDDFFEELRRTQKTETIKYEAAASRISDGIRLASSIDDFLDIHQEDQHVNVVGKAAIISAVLKAERTTKLFVSHSNVYNTMDISKVEETWFVKLIPPAWWSAQAITASLRQR